MTRRLVGWLVPPLVLCLLAAGLWGVSRLMADPEAEARTQSLRDELLRVESRNARLRTEIASLKAELARLRDGDAEALHHARTGLGMVRPGEVVYQFVPSGVDGAPAAAPAGPPR